MDPAQATTTTPSRPRERIALFDNIKGLLIALVVLGHMMHPVHNENAVLSGIFDIIYLFHMPLFILVSGLFAKSSYRDGRLNIDRVISFAVLGVIFQATLLLVNGTPVTPLKLLRFPSAPWYLISMAWWSALTPLLSKLGPSNGLVTSMALSLAIGFIELEEGFLAISRTLSFLPWFSLGYYLTSDELLRIKSSRWPRIAVGAAALIALARVVEPDAYRHFFSMVFGDNPYEDGGVDGVASKLVATLVALVFSLAILKIVPLCQGRLATLGRRTFQIYILHRLIRAALTFRTSFYDMPILVDPIAGTAIILLLSLGVTALTSMRCLEAPFNRLLTLKWTSVLCRGNRVE